MSNKKKLLKGSAAIPVAVAVPSPAAAAPAPPARTIFLPDIAQGGEVQSIAKPNGIGNGTGAHAGEDEVQNIQANCGNCLCFVTKDGISGECRGGTPTACIIGVQKHPLTGKQMPIIDGYFPPTHKDIWCGRWNGPARHVHGRTLVPVIAFKEVASD